LDNNERKTWKTFFLKVEFFNRKGTSGLGQIWGYPGRLGMNAPIWKGKKAQLKNVFQKKLADT